MEQQSSSSSSSVQNNSALYFARRKKNFIFDLQRKQAIGAMSPMEFKRRSILNRIYYLSNENGIISPLSFMDSERSGFEIQGIDSRKLNYILDMETFPKESNYLITISRNNFATIYDVSRNWNNYIYQVEKISTKDPIAENSVPNSIHWVLDGSSFSICSQYRLQFWDTNTSALVESVGFDSLVLNHIIGAKDLSLNKYVAVSGQTGLIHMVDITLGAIVMTLSKDTNPIRAMHWHPTHEFEFATGSDTGDIFLWDIRYPRNHFLKLHDEGFKNGPGHGFPLGGIRFYNNGNNLLSADVMGCIKNWETKTGHMLPNDYLSLVVENKNQWLAHRYHFAVTDNLKEDVAIMPSNDGMRIFDIETGLHLPHSRAPVLPIICATYDPSRSCVYGAWENHVKLWTFNRVNVECSPC